MILSYLFQLLRGWRLASLLASLVLLGVGGWLSNMPAALLGRAVDQLTEGEPATFAKVQPVLILIVVCMLGRSLAEWVGRYAIEFIAAKVERTEFVELMRHVLRLDLSLLTRERIGALNVRVHRSVSGVVALIKLVFERFLPMLITAFIAVGLTAPRHSSVALLMLLMGVVGTVITAVQIASQKGIRLSLLESREDMGAKVTELLWGLEYVRAQGLQELEVQESGKLADRLRERVFAHHRWMMSFDTVKQLLEGAGFLAVVGLGAWLAVTGEVTKGDVLAFALLYGSVMRPLRELHRIVDEAFDAGLRVRELVELRRLPMDAGLRGTALPEPQGETIVEASAFSVSYEAHPALRKVDFSVRRGEVIGIAGPSGAGKSTLLASILGLVSQYAGSLKLFGQEVRELDKAELARRVAYVPQVPFVLMGTLRDNLRYGSRKEVSDAELMQALEKARLMELFHRLPAGLDAMLAEQGRDLSGGERQRLMLARVFLSQGGLVILDEATSALDSENESLVQQALAELTARSAATFIVAHRLSTLSIADRILVIDNGAIVQEGAFEELSASPGLFRELLSLQDGRSTPGSRKEAPGERTSPPHHAVARNDRRLRYR